MCNICKIENKIAFFSMRWGFFFVVFLLFVFVFLEINSLSWCNQGCTEFYTSVENSHTLRRSTPDYTKITSNIQHLRLEMKARYASYLSFELYISIRGLCVLWGRNLS